MSSFSTMAPLKDYQAMYSTTGKSDTLGPIVNRTINLNLIISSGVVITIQFMLP